MERKNINKYWIIPIFCFGAITSLMIAYIYYEPPTEISVGIGTETPYFNKGFPEECGVKIDYSFENETHYYYNLHGETIIREGEPTIDATAKIRSCTKIALSLDSVV